MSLCLSRVRARERFLGGETKPNQTEPNERTNERKRGVERRGAARRRLLSISGHRYTSRPAARAYGIRTSARPTMCGGEREARHGQPASRPTSRPVTSIVFGSTARYIVAPSHESPIRPHGPSIGSLPYARFLINSSLAGHFSPTARTRAHTRDRQSCPRGSCSVNAFVRIHEK